jgi:hypothetical protein
MRKSPFWGVVYLAGIGLGGCGTGSDLTAALDVSPCDTDGTTVDADDSRDLGFSASDVIAALPASALALSWRGDGGSADVQTIVGSLSELQVIVVLDPARDVEFVDAVDSRSEQCPADRYIRVPIQVTLADSGAGFSATGAEFIAAGDLDALSWYIGPWSAGDGLDVTDSVLESAITDDIRNQESDMTAQVTRVLLQWWGDRVSLLGDFELSDGTTGNGSGDNASWTWASGD